MHKLGHHFWGAIFICLLVYVVGLVAFFTVLKKKADIAYTPVATAQAASNSSFLSMVLGARTEANPTPANGDPESYKIVVVPRRQMFNLSCEFAAATTIVYHYTNSPDFAVENAKKAEEILMGKVDISQNPNIGIRMGVSTPKTTEELYTNLNKGFGGADYYGIHAPPFIDVFASYHLAAKPILQDDAVVTRLQKALSQGHLVMAWVKVGYGGTVDASFTYGTVPIIRGEHAVVLHGYDKTGYFMMDPGNGTLKHISSADLFKATQPFPLPFLEVYTADGTGPTLEDTLLLGKTTGLSRGTIHVIVKNGTKKIGRASQAAEILRDFGYSVTAIQNAESVDYEGVTVSIKDSLKDYLYLLKKDLAASSYSVASMSADLSASASADAVIVVGE